MFKKVHFLRKLSMLHNYFLSLLLLLTSKNIKKGLQNKKSYAIIFACNIEKIAGCVLPGKVSGRKGSLGKALLLFFQFITKIKKRALHENYGGFCYVQD